MSSEVKYSVAKIFQIMVLEAVCAGVGCVCATCLRNEGGLNLTQNPHGVGFTGIHIPWCVHSDTIAHAWYALYDYETFVTNGQKATWIAIMLM